MSKQSKHRENYTPQVGYTHRQLTKMAKEKNIKYNKNELEKILGLEFSNPNEKFEKYCREKVQKPTAVIIINKKMGEKKVGGNPQIIKDKIRAKKDLKIKGDTFLVIKE